MSACLFMINPGNLTHKTIEEIEEMIVFWQTGLNPDLNNRFECDKAGGFQLNIEMAKHELLCRANKTTAHSVQFRIEHELREGAQNLKRALLDASSKGVGYVRFNDKNPNLWFEYITEEQLKEALK